MHMARETVFWQCYESFSSESFPNGYSPSIDRGISLANDNQLRNLIQTHRQKLYSPDTSEHRTGSSTKSSIHNDIRGRWRSFIEGYSGNRLTKDSDILVALEGIAQDVIVDTLGDRLVAGLSESRFLEELCWTVADHSKRPRILENWRAPSWSWASTTHPVVTPRENIPELEQTRHELVRVVSCTVPTKPSGELIDAFLSIECKLLAGEMQQHEWEAKILLPELQPELMDWVVKMDQPCARERDGLVRGIFLIPVAYNVEPKDDPEVCLEGIVLEICDESGKRFRRLGFFQVYTRWSFLPDEASEKDLAKLMKMVQETEAQIIEIV